MSAARITVTIPEQLARDARQAVDDGKVESVSAYVADALRHYGRSTTLRELLDQWWADDPGRSAVRCRTCGGPSGTGSSETGAFAVTTPSGLTMDAGALIAVERGQRRLRVLLDETERARLPIVVPVGPLAQVWRDGARASTLAFNLDGTLLAAASSLGDSGPTTVSLIDVADRREVSRLEVPQRGPIPPTLYFTAIISPVALALRPGGEVLCQQ